MNNVLNSALRKVSRELCIDFKIVDAVYKSYWRFIREQAESIPMRTISKEEFESTIHNFNLPYIGKLYVEYEKIENYKRYLKHYENARAKKNQANRLSSVGD